MSEHPKFKLSKDIFDDVLQIPKGALSLAVSALFRGSVNPFVMAQSSCSDVFLILDKAFQNCEGERASLPRFVTV